MNWFTEFYLFTGLGVLATSLFFIDMGRRMGDEAYDNIAALGFWKNLFVAFIFATLWPIVIYKIACKTKEVRCNRK